MIKKITFFLPTLNIGGVERVFITYANYLASLSYRVDFVLCKREGDLLPLLSSNINLYDLDDVQLRFSFYKLRKYIKKNPPDYIITGGDFPNFIAILSSLNLREKPKVIISQHNYYNIESKRLGWWANFTCTLMKVLYPMSHRVIAISDGIYDFLMKDIGIQDRKIVKIPNPIHREDIIIKSNYQPSIELPENYIVFIGRLGYVKNLSFLLNSFEEANIKDVKLLIVGNGEMMDDLKMQANRMRKGGLVSFVGAVENPLPILKKSQLLVLPSFSEAYPTILLEALCLNIPILATPTNGAKEILRDIPGTCFSTDFNDTEMFAKLLETCINNKIDEKIAEQKLSQNSIEVIGNKILSEIIENNENYS